ncbi:hypothetical protein WMY93_009918 [Mugilogobius chulae]|uniref:Phosphoseryl-tRNA kinase n=1 Tax=Mugilogobius chulae TaxID=88201 RepID=A0AAW0PER3_9GOBI
MSPRRSSAGEREDEPGEHTEWKQHRQAVLKRIEHFLHSQSSDQSDLPDFCDFINKASWERCVQGLHEKPSLKPAPVVFLLDDNFYYPSMRYEVYQLARKHSLGFCQIFLHCDLETCIRRNQKRAEPVSSEVMEEMERRFEPPNAQKNIWEQNSIRISTTDRLDSADISVGFDLVCAEKPAEPDRRRHRAKGRRLTE